MQEFSGNGIEVMDGLGIGAAYTLTPVTDTGGVIVQFGGQIASVGPDGSILGTQTGHGNYHAFHFIDSNDSLYAVAHSDCDVSSGGWDITMNRYRLPDLYPLSAATCLSNATANQTYPRIIGSSGTSAIVYWQDARAGNGDIYTSRISHGSVNQIFSIWAANFRKTNGDNIRADHWLPLSDAYTNPNTLGSTSTSELVRIENNNEFVAELNINMSSDRHWFSYQALYGSSPNRAFCCRSSDTTRGGHQLQSAGKKSPVRYYCPCMPIGYRYWGCLNNLRRRD